MTTTKDTVLEAKFLDMQAEVGVTKHIGGFAATNELLALCHIEQARNVLNIGCGIGVGSTHIARKYGCHVVGLDISEKMIEWSCRRAREAGVEDRTEFRVGDVLQLPFDADRFDVVFCESVLIFVEDKARAIRECARVTRPGGFVGLNEGFWFERPLPEYDAKIKAAIGPYIATLETWKALWEASGLQERSIKIHNIDNRQELHDRIEWIGWRWLVRAWGRALRLYITKPAIKQSIKDMFDVPVEVYQYMGYGLFTGKK